MRVKVLIFTFFCFSVFLFYGCAGISKKDKPGSPQILEPQAVLKLSDIPVPVGFKPLSENSYFFESEGVRVGLLKYRGKVKIDRVVNFYKEQMPMYNWYLLNVVEYGDRLLNFERDRESCIITLIPKGNIVTIMISLGPKAQLHKRADRPVK